MSREVNIMVDQVSPSLWYVTTTGQMERVDMEALDDKLDQREHRIMGAILRHAVALQGAKE